MLRRALLLLTVAGIYVYLKRNSERDPQPAVEPAADAQWANEGGANAPATV